MRLNDAPLNPVNEGIKGLPHKAETRDGICDILEVTPRAGMGVNAADDDIFVCVQAAKPAEKHRHMFPRISAAPRDGDVNRPHSHLIKGSHAWGGESLHTLFAPRQAWNLWRLDSRTSESRADNSWNASHVVTLCTMCRVRVCQIER
jgi:hypothetical protein